MKVAILGASPKPDRYAHKAQQMLMDKGHDVFPVSVDGKAILDVPGYASLSDIAEPIDTLTLYLGPARFTALVEDVIALNPRRVILNPGTEDEAIATTLRNAGILVEEACTLVLLGTGQF